MAGTMYTGLGETTNKERGMQRLRSVTIGYALVALCCFSQSASESRAENRVVSEGVIAGAESGTVGFPIAEGIRLAQSGKKGQAQGGSDNWKRMGETVVSGGDEPTKVKITGNTVLVPATLAYGGNEVDIHLVLDTGASKTTINTEVADQLSVNLSKAKKAKVRVAGGAVIEARLVKMDRLTVGPHTKRNWDMLVVPHKGPAAGYDGLLGMDVLRGLKYRVDFKKEVIIWE
jgi:clan AA aspartic protease (TIGR02281 family)